MESLPIDSYLPKISEALKNKPNLILSAAPGSGKTTRLPPSLLSFGTGKIWVLEPRRMAAIAAAHRIAEDQKWTVGQEVGYQVRLGSKYHSKTRLIFMTEALLTRHLLEDIELNGIDIVVLDEFHERSIHVDLALGVLKEFQDLGGKIRIIIMSATLEEQRLQSYLGDTATTMQIPGQIKKLNLVYSKIPQIINLGPTFFEQCFKSIREAFLHSKRDLLVFLPGVGEIRRLKMNLQEWGETQNIQILSLHGSLPIEEQTQVLSSNENSKQRRIILATNVAESSVTVSGVDTVIDTGLMRQNSYDQNLRIDSLQIKRISKSSAKQRAGRAARQYEGTCYRLWTQLDEVSMPDDDVPEIQRVDLSETVLYMAALGIPDAKNFSWFSPPPPNLLKIAYNQVRQLGAYDNGITQLGKQLLKLPLPLRAGRVFIDSCNYDCPDLGALVASILQEKDFLNKDHDFGTGDIHCDLSYRIHLLAEYQQAKLIKGSSSPLRDKTINKGTVENILKAKHELLKSIDFKKSEPFDVNINSEKLLTMILWEAFKNRLCRRRKDSDRAVMVGGRGVKLSPQSVVTQSEFFIALSLIDIGGGTESLVNLGVPVSKAQLEHLLEKKTQKETEIIYDQNKGRFFKKEVRKYLELPLDDGILTPLVESELSLYWPNIFKQNIEQIRRENQEFQRLYGRLEFLKSQIERLPDSVKESVHGFFLNEWPNYMDQSIEQAVYGESSWNTILHKDLSYYFFENLPLFLKEILNRELPSQIKVPSNSLIPIHYHIGKAPYIEVRIQEIFGMEKSPDLFYGRFLLSFHLLGPNYRPVQITNDLSSFWKNGYLEVRKELRLKYPKHQWPENPADGIAEAKGRRGPR